MTCSHGDSVASLPTHLEDASLLPGDLLDGVSKDLRVVDTQGGNATDPRPTVGTKRWCYYADECCNETLNSMVRLWLNHVDKCSVRLHQKGTRCLCDQTTRLQVVKDCCFNNINTWDFTPFSKSRARYCTLVSIVPSYWEISASANSRDKNVNPFNLVAEL